LIYPAFLDLIRDDEIADHPTALRLYVRLLGEYPLILVKPHHVKAEYWAGRLSVRRDSITAALRLLIDRGYLVEIGRTTNNVREVMFAIERTCSPNQAAPPAA
jgi:hypothetical protein